MLLSLLPLPLRASLHPKVRMIYAPHCLGSLAGIIFVSLFKFSFVARGFLGVRLMFSQGSADFGFLASAIGPVPFTPPHRRPAPFLSLPLFLCFVSSLRLVRLRLGSFSRCTFPPRPLMTQVRTQGAPRRQLCVSTSVSKDLDHAKEFKSTQFIRRGSLGNRAVRDQRRRYTFPVKKRYLHWRTWAHYQTQLVARIDFRVSTVDQVVTLIFSLLIC